MYTDVEWTCRLICNKWIHIFCTIDDLAPKLSTGILIIYWKRGWNILLMNLSNPDICVEVHDHWWSLIQNKMYTYTNQATYEDFNTLDVSVSLWNNWLQGTLRSVLLHSLTYLFSILCDWCDLGKSIYEANH